MKFTLEIECDNAAFDGLGGPSVEIARILRTVADRIEDTSLDERADPRPARDTNGNRVGFFRLEGEAA